jgi:hypothetical protein
MLSLDLLDSLPLARYLKASEIENRRFTIEDSFPHKDLPTPQSFFVFKMSYEPKLKRWIPFVVGKAKRTEATKPDSKRIDYTIEFGQEIERGASLWIQVEKGRASNQKAISKVVDAELGRYGLSLFDFQDMILETIASGYAGFRYAMPLVKDNVLLSKVPLIGVFTEIRGGPLSGLRFYWDMAPKTQVDVGSADPASFYWSRISAGWSIGLDFEESFLSRVDVVPRFGIMSFDANLPVVNQLDETTLVDYRLKNVYNLGAELGFETVSPFFLVRLWGSIDFSGLIGDSTNKVSSLKTGLDTYWDFFKIGRTLETSIVIFAFGEQLTIEGPPRLLDDEETQVGSLSFTQGFAGAGLTITW